MDRPQSAQQSLNSVESAFVPVGFSGPGQNEIEDVCISFRHAMREVGLETSAEIIPDGKIHRCHIEGDKPGNRNGWYTLHLDHPAAGSFGCWKRGISQTWTSLSRPMTKAEEAAYRARLEVIHRQHEEEQEQVYAECRAWCADAWAKATEATDENPYLKRKGVRAHGGVKIMGDTLMVPVRGLDGTLHGLQFIAPDGSKLFKTGTAKAGHFFMFGEIRDRTILIGEGYATGASLYEATGHSVVIAFDAGNLKPVAEQIRAKYPDCSIVICADNDRFTKGNPGLTKAREAARPVGARLCAPAFGGKSKGTDFNDLHQAEGLEAVRACIMAAAEPGEVTTLKVAQGTQWSEPVPIPAGLRPVKALDPAMIPDPIRPWILDIADRMQIPPDFSAAAAIVALGSTIGRGCGIYPKRHDDWLELPNLWGTVVGRPAMMKTPAMSEAQRHLIRLEMEAHDAYACAMAKFKEDAEIRQIARKAITEQIKAAFKKDAQGEIDGLRQRLTALEAEEPTRRRFQTQDATIEMLGVLLNKNPRGILVNRDELIGWLRSLDKDDRESDRAFYLEAWNGKRPYTYDRIGRGTLDIHATCVSIFGAIVPGKLAEYVRQAIRGGKGDDGLIQRFQVMVWPDAPKRFQNVDRWPDTTAKNRAWEIFKRLSGDIPGAVMEQGADIPALRFSTGGQGVFDEWRSAHEMKLRGDHGLSPAMESHLAKYRKLMPALALIFQLVDVADGKAEGPVSEAAAIRAASWCDYLESHANRVYGATNTPEMDAARAIARHIKRGAVVEKMTQREIYRKGWTHLSTPEDVKAGMEVLEECGWLSVETVYTRGRPTDIVHLNPKLEMWEGWP